jgi:hypothetical protein
MTKEIKERTYGSFPSKRLEQRFRIDNILLRNMINFTNNKSFNCWDFMNCPEQIRKKCWAYRLNLGKECWILSKKAHKKYNWKKTKDFSHCEFYNFILKNIIK